jgi:hypothetical protein
MGIEHDHITNTFKGGEEFHSVATLLQMFQALVQKVKDAAAAEINENKENNSNQHYFFENLQLTEEHLVFKFSSIDSRVKCTEIVMSVNVMKVTSRVITSVIISLSDLLPMVGLEVGMAINNAAGCNWVLFHDTLSTHTF